MNVSAPVVSRATAQGPSGLVQCGLAATRAAESAELSIIDFDRHRGGAVRRRLTSLR